MINYNILIISEAEFGRFLIKKKLKAFCIIEVKILGKIKDLLNFISQVWYIKIHKQFNY